MLLEDAVPYDNQPHNAEPGIAVVLNEVSTSPRYTAQKDKRCTDIRTHDRNTADMVALADIGTQDRNSPRVCCPVVEQSDIVEH